MLPWFLRRWLDLVRGGPDTAPVDPESFVRPPNTAFDGPMADAIRAAPDDPGPFRRYAEFLRENNDPRGDLVLRMLEGADAGEPDPVLLGPLYLQAGVEVTWRWGFWDTLVIRDPWGDRAADLLRAALDHPSALVLRGLTVASGRMDAVPDVLADGPSLLLRSLVVDAEGSALGAWAAVWARVQDVEELVMLGSSPQLGAMALPRLRSFEIRGPVDDGALADLRRASLPALEQLLVPEPERLRDTFGARVRAS